MIAHWDEVDPVVVDKGPLGFTRFDLGEAAGTLRVGVTRAQIESGKQSSPVHIEGDEEEIFYVLGGSGLSWQDEKVYKVGPGDCVVHLVGEEAHTMIGGRGGLDVLAFGERTDVPLTYLPRAKVVRMGITLDVSAGAHPWDREAEAGDLDLPEPEAERPGTIVNAAEIEGEYEGRWKPLGRTAGAVRTGLNLLRFRSGESGAPPHCHSADEEIFVVLEGGGTLELWPRPGAGGEPERHPVRAGHVVSRPAGTGVAHRFVTGETGMTYLAYGTREPNDICYYPRSNKVYFRGIGLMGRLEHLDYMDGEPED